jgi:hypothetical protein
MRRRLQRLVGPFVIMVLVTLGFAVRAGGGLSTCWQSIDPDVCWVVASQVKRGCCNFRDVSTWYRRYPCWADKYTKGGTTVYWTNAICDESTGEVCTPVNDSCPC